MGFLALPIQVHDDRLLCLSLAEDIMSKPHDGRSQATHPYNLLERKGIELHFLILKLFLQPRHLSDVTQSLTEPTIVTGQQENKINSYMSNFSRKQPEHCSLLSPAPCEQKALYLFYHAKNLGITRIF